MNLKLNQKEVETIFYLFFLFFNTNIILFIYLRDFFLLGNFVVMHLSRFLLKMHENLRLWNFLEKKINFWGIEIAEDFFIDAVCKNFLWKTLENFL